MASANTHLIGGGTCNLSVNVLEDERTIIGKAAFSKGFRSVGDYVRHLLQAGIEKEDPKLAEKYKAARISRYAQTFGLVFFTGLFAWQALIGGVDPRRRNKPVARRVKIVREVEA